MTSDAIDSVAPSKADATPGHGDWGTKVRRYNWRSAGSLGWPFPTLKYKCIFQRKYTEAIYQTALGNCYGLKLAECQLQFKK